MIHYHGGPITPLSVANAVWTGRHAFVSFEYPDQIAFAAEVCQSFALDNGAFSVWRRGAKLDVGGYASFVAEWWKHPGFDWCLIPDVIDGDEYANDSLIDAFFVQFMERLGCEPDAETLDLPPRWRACCVPVWHLHESFDRLARLCREWPRVALGSSGAWADVGTPAWWKRTGEAMDFICDEDGRPPCKLHGLRMLNPTVFSQLPLASADSTNVAQNHARERRIYGLTPAMAGLKIVDRIEQHACAPRWNKTYGVEFNMDLVG